MVTVYSEGPWQAGRIGCKNPMKINKGKSEAPPLHRNNPRHQGKLRDAQLQQKRSRWLGGQMWASSVSLWPRRVAAPQAANRPGEMMFLFCSALLLHIWKAGSSSGLTGTRNAGLCKKLCMDGNIWRARGSSGNRKFHVSIRSWKKKNLTKNQPNKNYKKENQHTTIHKLFCDSDQALEHAARRLCHGVTFKAWLEGVLSSLLELSKGLD